MNTPARQDMRLVSLSRADIYVLQDALETQWGATWFHAVNRQEELETVMNILADELNEERDIGTKEFDPLFPAELG